MSLDARAVFWGLYVGRSANLLAPPGLFLGGLTALADESGVGIVTAQNAIAEMVKQGIVQVDERRKLIRLTEMPDRGNRPSNGKCIYGWYRRWEELPNSPLKYRHIELLAWLCQPFTKDHEGAWAHTFGGEDIQPRFRVAMEQGERDSSAQTSFFGISTTSHIKPTILATSETHKTPDSNEINDIGNPFGASVLGVSVSVSVPVGEESDADSPESDSRPGFSVLDLVGALGETASDRVSLGPPMSDALTTPLRLLVAECHRESVTLDDVRLAGSWLAAGGLGYRDDLGMKWLAKAGELFDVVGLARKWDKRGRPELADSRRRSTGGHLLTGTESWPSGVQAI